MLHHLAGEASRHEVRVGDEARFANCALDALMLPFLLDRPVELRSRSPLDGALVEVVADRSSLRAAPEQAVLSLGVRLRGRGGIQERCCSLINLFPTREEYERWAGGQRGALLAAVPIERGFALARGLASLWRAGSLLRRAGAPASGAGAGLASVRRARRRRR